MTLHIESRGAGADLVLIHGWAMHGGIFAPLTDLLAERFRLHLVDLPGHGYSRDEADGLNDLAVLAQRLLDRLPDAIWAGWSLGGLVALQAALLAPARVGGLVEIASSPRFTQGPQWPHGVPAEVFAQFGVGLQADWRGQIERFLALETLGTDTARADLRELKAPVFARGEPALAALRQGLARLGDSDYRQTLTALTMPSLWLAGRRDRIVAPAAMRWAAQQCRDGEFREINSGHAPFINHAPEVAQAILDFADRHALS